jgi:predicted nucleotide-binding protein
MLIPDDTGSGQSMSVQKKTPRAKQPTIFFCGTLLSGENRSWEFVTVFSL